MKRIQALPQVIFHALVAALAVVGTIFCVTSAYSLNVGAVRVILAAAVFCLLFSLCFQEKRLLLAVVPLVGLGAALGYFLGLFSGLSASFWSLLHALLTRFSGAYPNLSFAIPPEPAGFTGDYTLLFVVLAAVLSLWCSWAVGYRSGLICIAGTLPFLLLCVVTNDTPPHVLPLVLLLVGWVTTMLQVERPGEPPSMTVTRGALTLMAVALLLGVVGTVYPKADTADQDLPAPVEELLSHLPGPMQNALSRDSKGFSSQELGADVSETLDLTTQGVRDRKDTVMLQISSTEPGVLYLRGAAKDIYTGSTWESRDDATIQQSVYAHTSLGTYFGSSYQAAVEVRNLRDRAQVAFTPYGFISCHGADDILSDLRVPCHQEDYINYFWPGVGTLDLTTSTDNQNADYDQYVSDTCLDLPQDTRQRLYDLALEYGYDPSLSTLETVAWTAEFVRTVGRYQLNVSRQPTNYDFAVYFLTESQAGYCVHFATAAATMLRALGVPSRYASGYRVEVAEAGAVTDVTDMDTHAWAEFYLSGLGWLPLETTPGFGESVSLPEVAHAPQAPEPSPSPSPVPETPTQTPAAPSPEPSQAPATPAPAPAQPQETAAAGRGISLWWLLAIPLALALGVGAMLVRHGVLLRRRDAAFRDPDPNQALIQRWAHLERLVPWGAEIPDGMEALALKARFSQHKITPAELAGFSQVTSQIQIKTELGLSPWRRFRFRWLSCLDLRRTKS